jgi:hypothetical protein
MEMSDRSLLRQHRIILSDRTPVTSVLLFMGDLLSKHQQQEIMTHNIFDQGHVLLDILEMRGPQAFQCFKQALIDADCSDLAVLLQPVAYYDWQWVRLSTSSPVIESHMEYPSKEACYKDALKHRPNNVGKDMSLCIVGLSRGGDTLVTEERSKATRDSGRVKSKPAKKAKKQYNDNFS